MLSPAAPDNHNGFLILDVGLTLIGIALSYALPTLGLGFFRRIERAFTPLARKKGLAVTLTGLSVILIRLAILPISPVPRPFVTDDFSFLLAAETFANGRLANPTPAMWKSFETIHETMKPTYMSMYFPGQGLLLAAGKVLLGNPWFAVLIVSALMCAAICWALQAWLPANWALLGGIIAVARLGSFQLLDQHLPRRRIVGRPGRRAGSGVVAAAHKEWAGRLWAANGSRHGDSRGHSAVRRRSAVFARYGSTHTLDGER